jgi:DNA polymerase-3 subunit delta'
MWEIIGHERAVEALRRDVASDTVPHALLLTGPAGIGKTRLALELAKALNCTGAEPPCQRCLHCRQIESGSHPDVTVVEQLEGKHNIGIEQIRDLREAASLRPFQGRTKVYIVAGAEALTLNAADALLKTLEEPQPQVKLVLTAMDAEALPTTVVSRCRHLALQSVEASCIAAALLERGQEQAPVERLARLAQGNVGWALQAARQPKLAAQQEETVARLSEVLDLSLDARLRLAEQLASDRKDRSAIRRHLELLLLLARDLLLMSQGLPPQLASGQQQEALARQARRFSLAQIHAYIRSLRVAMERIDQNVDPRLTLEALLVNLP